MAVKDEPKTLTPKLRFPEFRDGPGWNCTRLKDVLKSISNGLSLTQGGDGTGFRVTRIETIADGVIDLARTGFVDTTDDISAYRLNTGDILFSNINSVAHIGKTVFIDRDYDLYHGMNLLRLEVDSDANSPQFISYSLNTEGVRSDIRSRANKAVNQASINQTELGKTLLASPDPAEQRKIADCLTSLDEWIAAEGRRLEALKAHKKGLMQQLFPREGETLPRLRFPEFRDAGEWESTTVGDHVDLLSGYPFDGEDIVADSAGVPLMRGINITEGTIRHDPEFDRFYLGPTDDLAKYRLSQGDLVIGMDGSKVGKNSALITAADAGALLVQRVARLRSDRQVTIDFIFQHVHSPKFHAYVDRINTSSGIPHISAKQIRDFQFALPSEAEQHRIAACLSSLDALIAAQSRKLDGLRAHKKGLMQQLFPSPEGN